MNDCIEFVTWPANQNLFHRIRTKALVFHVKGQKAAVGLSARSGKDCCYWVTLDEHNCRIYERGKVVCFTPTENILSISEYQRFWISWYGYVLKFGQNENAEAILSLKRTKINLKYVTYSFVGNTHELYWKCHIPSPININLPLAKFNEGKAYWMKVDNQLPDNAVIGGFENELLYIVRSPLNSSLTPGKFVPSEGIGYISWRGVLYIKPREDLKVLCGYNMIWKKTRGSKIPAGAVKGGYSEIGHETLYIGRAYHNGHVIPGKVQPSHNVCYFSYEDKEEYSHKYEILVYPHPCPSAGDHYVKIYGYTYYDEESSTSSSSSEDW